MDFIRFCTFFSEVRQFFYHTLPYYYWFFHIIMDSSISFPHSVPLQIVINHQIITDSSTFLTDFSIFFTDYYIVSWFSLVSRSSIFFQIFYGFFQILPYFFLISMDFYWLLQIPTDYMLIIDNNLFLITTIPIFIWWFPTNIYFYYFLLRLFGVCFVISFT